MRYHTCYDVAQSTRCVAGGKYFLERLYKSSQGNQGQVTAWKRLQHSGTPHEYKMCQIAAFLPRTRHAPIGHCCLSPASATQGAILSAKYSGKLHYTTEPGF
ncbi:hypothetical protein Y032_0567g34 [Ancylostoma ceylanicum]|uniref:Uncharacterized protein n=1 Tax=Ancylostoma ceylanicum TaxID=53326 RepID=A0A016WQF7_9BILA|nr:hypothetical protein Y032_0567g34 [Ancylostoma ceylanicum]